MNTFPDRGKCSPSLHSEGKREVKITSGHYFFSKVLPTHHLSSPAHSTSSGNVLSSFGHPPSSLPKRNGQSKYVTSCVRGGSVRGDPIKRGPPTPSLSHTRARGRSSHARCPTGGRGGKRNGDKWVLGMHAKGEHAHLQLSLLLHERIFH